LGFCTVLCVEVVVVGVVNVDVRDVLFGVFVPGGTLRQEVDMREAVVFHRFHDDLFGLIRIDRGGPGHVRGTSRQCL
jgi:hypothetical protein